MTASYADADIPVPFWPAYLPTARAEATEAVQFWPTKKAEAVELGGSGPRHDQHPEGNQSMSTATTWRPTHAELDQATDRTARAIADPSVSMADRERLAELEAKLYDAFPAEPRGDRGLEAHEREMEAGG